MSFSEETKRELSRIKPEKSCCMLSEISALTQSCASLRFQGRGRISLVYKTENMALAKRIFLLLKLRLNLIPVIEYAFVSRFGGRRICTLTLKDQDAKQLMLSLRMLKTTEAGLPLLRGIPRSAYTKRCCRGAYLRGAFLGAGMMLNPEKGYLLKFASSDPGMIRGIGGMLEKSGIPSSVHRGEDGAVLKVTQGDGISAFLTLTGAHNAMMKMEDIRIRHESKNRANRAANCDEGNIKKQLQSAQAQAGALQRLLESENVPEDILKTARVRLDHMDATVEELGAFFSPPLSKSGAYHRLQKAMRYASDRSL
ncbi:MAG: DNA-binding protein WhiA [Clostridia bacterium]|nr:DNA-binding protein WhiA [Clostridia bacterium]